MLAGIATLSKVGVTNSQGQLQLARAYVVRVVPGNWRGHPSTPGVPGTAVVVAVRLTPSLSDTQDALHHLSLTLASTPHLFFQSKSWLASYGPPTVTCTTEAQPGTTGSQASGLSSAALAGIIAGSCVGGALALGLAVGLVGKWLRNMDRQKRRPGGLGHPSFMESTSTRWM